MTSETWGLYSAAAALSLAAVAACARLSRKSGAVAGNAQRLVGFAVAIAAAILVLSPPLDELSDRFFSAHMIEHELLLFTMPVALLAARPLPAALVMPWRLLPSAWRRAFGGFWHRRKRFLQIFVCFERPLAALALLTFSLWLWHVPTLYDLALRNNWVHAAEHILFLATALVYWRPLLNGPHASALNTNAKRAAYLMAGGMQGGVLGALIALHGRVIYNGYLDQPGANLHGALVDQQIGGAIMWFSGAIFCGMMAATVIE